MEELQSSSLHPDLHGDALYQDILQRHYAPDEADIESDILYQRALEISGGDQLVALEVYPELRRSIDAFALIDKHTPDLERAEELMHSVVAYANERMDAVLAVKSSKKHKQ